MNSKSLKGFNVTTVFACLGGFLLLGVGCSAKENPDIQAAILELQGLNSQIDVGINLAEYKQTLQSAKVAVDRATATDQTSEQSLIIQKVMSTHLAALNLWQCNLEDSQYEPWAEDICRSEVYENLIFPLYPQVQEQLEPHKSVQTKRDQEPFNVYSVNEDAVVQLLWKFTEDELSSLQQS